MVSVRSESVVRRALVTGASRGIGRGITAALAANGVHVAVCARTACGLQESIEAHALQTAVLAVPADMSVREQTATVVNRAADLLGGGIDILIHNAGMASSAKLADVTLDDWDRLVQVNATAAFQLAQAASAHMIDNKWGRISVGSLYSRAGVTYGSSYVASKHAVLGLTRVLATELIRYKVTANTIIPGWTDTEMVQEQTDNVAAKRDISRAEAIKLFLSSQPLGRLITIDEVGALVAYLCSDVGAPITGQAINIDGGMYQG